MFRLSFCAFLKGGFSVRTVFQGILFPCYMRDNLFVPFIIVSLFRAVFPQILLLCCFLQEIIFKGGFSVCTKKYFRGFSVRFVFRTVSFCAIFKENIRIPVGFLSCRFKEGVSWDSHSEYTRPSIPAIVHRLLRKTRA